MVNGLPSISLVIPTLNSERTLRACLESISGQEYPEGKVEVILIDGGSADSTLKIGRDFNARIMVDETLREDQEQRKAIGLLSAKNQIIGFIDSDNILPHNTWILKMIEPFMSDKSIVVTQPLRYTYDKSASLLNRYFSLFGVNDPIPYYLNKRDRLSWAEPDKWNLLGEARDFPGYFSVRFSPGEVPTLGANGFFVRKDIVNQLSFKPKDFFHIDFNLDLVNNGFNTYGIVKDGIIHLSGGRLSSFFYKRYFYMKQYYFKNKVLRRFKMYRPSDKWKLLKYIVFSLSLIEPFWQSLRGYSKIRDKAWFLHPLICFSMLFIYGYAVIEWRVLSLLKKKPK
ncbi:MAG: glycosyltransferase [Candidatus Omnitrophota bacterium]